MSGVEHVVRIVLEPGGVPGCGVEVDLDEGEHAGGRTGKVGLEIAGSEFEFEL